MEDRDRCGDRRGPRACRAALPDTDVAARIGAVLAEGRYPAGAGERADLVRAAQAVAAATHGPSLVALALLYGIPLTLFGLAMVLDGYPTWVGHAGAVVGAVTLSAAAGLYLSPTLFPGALLYGVLASMVAQLWLLGTGVVMLRRATGLGRVS